MSKHNKIEICEPQKYEFQREALCGENGKLLHAYDHLFAQWLGIDRFQNNILKFFSSGIRSNGVPLVEHIIQSGLHAYSDSLSWNDRHYYPHERMHVFIVGCLLALKQICCFWVEDKDSKETWTSSSTQSFEEWSSNKSNLLIVEGSTNIDSNSFYQNYVPRNIQLAMRRFGHEKTILVDSVSTSI